MSDIHKVVHALSELEECGGDPKLLAKKLDSNLTLTEQNEHLTMIRDGLTVAMANCLEQERVALKARDDALEAKKTAEKQRDAALEELAITLGVKPIAVEVTSKVEELRNKCTQLEKEAASFEAYIEPALWLLGVLWNQPILLRQHAQAILDLLNSPPPKHEYTDEIGRKLTELIIQKVREHGGLVSKTQYLHASVVADNLKHRVDSIIQPFLQKPTQQSDEVKLGLIGALIDSGLTKENFEEFTRKLSISWRKCPIHKDVNLIVKWSTLRFECTYPGCNYFE